MMFLLLDDEIGTSLIFGLQHVDYTQWKTTCKARKVTEFFVDFRYFYQKTCPSPISMLN